MFPLSLNTARKLVIEGDVNGDWGSKSGESVEKLRSRVREYEVHVHVVWWKQRVVEGKMYEEAV